MSDLRCTNCAYEIDEANALGMCYNCQQAYEKGRQAGTDKPTQADEPGLYEVTIFKTVDGWARYYKSAEEARQDGAKTKKRYMETETNSNVEYFFDITQENEEIE